MLTRGAAITATWVPSLPSATVQLTAKSLFADKIVVSLFADNKLTAKPLPSVKVVFAVSYG